MSIPERTSIDKDEHGYFFSIMREWPPGQRRRTGSPAAIVTCKRGRMAVVDEKLSHFIDGQRRAYEADWLMQHTAWPPVGLAIDLFDERD